MERHNNRGFNSGSPLISRRNPSTVPTVSATEIINLRRGDDGNLVPIGMFRPVPSLNASRTPLGQIGAYLVAASGTILEAVDQDGLQPVIAASLPGKALCASPCADGMLAVMTEAGPVKVSVTGLTLSVTDLSADFPPITLTATDSVPVTADVAGRTLSRSYSSGRLDKADFRNVTDDLAAAYTHIAAEGSAAGVFVQPVLARYKLRDRAGNLLYTSAPVLLCHSSGAQCCDPVAVYSDDRTTLKPYTLTAESWILSAVIGQTPSARGAEVATAEICVTPQFHPYCSDDTGRANVGRASSASSPFLRVTLPGAQAGLGANWKGAAARIIMKAIARIDELEERVAVINMPFASGARTVAVSVSPDPDAAGVSRRLRTALARPVARRVLSDVLLSAPHTFSASVSASDASTTAWGNLAVHRFRGYQAQNFIGRTTSGTSWRVYAKIRFADGSSLSRTDSGSGPVPSLFSPVLSYPSADAVEMDLQLTADGTVTTARFPLVADESGRMAVYVASPVKPFMPESEPVPEIAETDSPVDVYPDAVAIADAGNPSRAVLVARPGGGPVRALRAGRIASQSWEFGRCRFIAGAEGGIISIGVGSGRKTLSLRNLSGGSVPSAQAMTAAGASVFALTGADGDIIEIPASGAVRPFASAEGYTALAFNHVRDELLAFRPDGSARVFCLDEGGDSYIRTEPAVRSVADTGQCCYLVTDQNVCRMEESPFDGPLPVRISYAFVPSGLCHDRATAFGAYLTASSLDGCLTISGTGISRNGTWPMLTASIHGEVRGPLVFRPIARSARRLSSTLDGMTTCDFKFKSFTFNTL